MTETNARTRAEEIFYLVYNRVDRDGGIESYEIDEAEKEIEKALLAEREEARSEAIRECAEIAQSKWQQHTGFAGDYDGGAASCARFIKEKLLALLKK